MYLRSPQTIGSNLWVSAFAFAFLPDNSKLSEYNRIRMWGLFHLILQGVGPIYFEKETLESVHLLKR